MYFDECLQQWKIAAFKAAAAEAEYRKAHAEAFITSTGRNEAARKADADAATDKLRQNRDICQIEEQAARYQVDHALRRTAPERAA